MSKMKTFAEHLRDKRKELKVSQEELSTLSGVPVETIVSIEGGQGCSFSTYAVLIKFLTIGE